MTTKHQISLSQSFSDCQNLLLDESPSFFSLISQHIDLKQFISDEFHHAFYRSIGRKRLYPLHGFLYAFIFQKIFSIPTDSLLLLFLHFSKKFRDFCRFQKVPDASLFSRFKSNFQPYLQDMFQHMVDFTEPICQLIDSSLANIITFDTSGIELYVTENNPKMLNSLIKKLKSTYKNSTDVDPYKMAYRLMPSNATSAPHAKQMYINGHFCYADKFAIITNGLDIIRHISFLNDDSLNSLILNFISLKNRILLTKINPLEMQHLLFPFFQISLLYILISTLILFSEILLLILLIYMENYFKIFIFLKLLSHIILEM